MSSRIALSLVLCLALQGCTVIRQAAEISGVFASARQRIDAGHQGFGRKTIDGAERQQAQDVDRPWLAGAPQPLGRDVTLPAALRADVRTTLVFADGPIDLPGIARRLMAATGIPVHISPEALLPAEAFLPRLAAGDAALAVPAPLGIDLVDVSEPLARILDRIAARLSIRWRYQQDRIEFYRTETRVFDVHALTLNAHAQASLGQAEGDRPGSFASASGTRLAGGGQDALATIRARLEPFLSRAGFMVAEPGAGAAIVITDTPDVLENITRYLARENRALTRRIRLVFEELTIQASGEAELGMDWQAIFSSAHAAASLTGVGVSAPPVALSASAEASISQGIYKGSAALIKALGRKGQIVRHTSMPVLTLNRRPVTHAVRTTFSYVDQVQVQPVTQGMGMAMPPVSVSQREQTVGSLITLVPEAMDNGRVLLSIAYDNTVAQPLRSVTFGSKDNPLQLQQITIDGNGIVQQVALQPGQPLLISGFDRQGRETESRRLNPGLPLALGGSEAASTHRLGTIIIVTAQIEEG
ncbi:hypothetical protein ERD78_08960 [Allopusillimonas soli]|uniref:Type IVB pilus formation R64 PilN family outer membrane protein n=1 Tax=Allopusillimonas soli TaxID=659016 RepID=A0A853FBI9_9BURK|nr:hypothetical protein [Allopusillimonas soli]NYT37002.1 hypothetical protein [Allopusillimonas soli]TEA75447.1 hypothetical protein ERD78_08960 [Allopusillimonas soli]